MKYDVSFDKIGGYGIDHHQIANEIIEKIKANNMGLIDDNNHNKDTFDVRFCMGGIMKKYSDGPIQERF